MSISVKNVIAFTIIFLLFAGTGYYEYQSASTEWEQIKKIENQTLQSALMADEMKLYVVQVQQWLTDISATRGEDGLDDGFDEAANYASLFQERLQRMKQINPQDEARLSEIGQAFEAYYASGKTMAAAYIEKGTQYGNQIMGDFDKTAEEINRRVDEYRQEKLQQITGSVSHITKSLEDSQRLILIMVFSVLLVSSIIAFFLSRSVVKPLKRLVRSAQTIAAGDLSKPINVQSQDEVGQLGQAFESMRVSLLHLIQELKTAASEVAASSDEMAAGAEVASVATKEIASSLEGIANGAEIQLMGAEAGTQRMNELVTGLNQIACTAASVSDMAQTASGEAKQGDTALNNVSQQMQMIQHSVSDLAELVERLGTRSNEIGSIVEVITAISGQTNLLALNAAIEAARAGEQGRGFAIVADEVRKLAEQSKESAESIQQLISGIQADTEAAVDAMAKGNEEVEEGMQVVLEASSAFASVRKSIEHVSCQIEEMAQAAEEMSTSSHHVLTSVLEMERIAKEALVNTQHAAANAEQHFASSEEVANSSALLSSRAQALQDLTAHFKV